MPLNLEDKRAIVVSVNAAAAEALSAVVADYRGLSVSEMTALHVKARETGVYLKVVRNSNGTFLYRQTDFCMGYRHCYYVGRGIIHYPATH